MYNVLDNGKLILENVTAGEVRQAIGDPDISVWKYAQNGHKTQGRYTIQDTGKTVEKKEEKTGRKRETNTVPDEMWEEWVRACNVFKGIEWQKRC